jgi:hypothetical protein
MPVFVLELQGIRIPGTWVGKRVWIANKGRRCTPAAHHYVPTSHMRQRGAKDTPPERAIWPTARASLPNPLSASATYPFGPEAFPTSAPAFAPKARPRCGQLTCPPMRITPSRMAKPCCSGTAHSVWPNGPVQTPNITHASPPAPITSLASGDSSRWRSAVTESVQGPVRGAGA